MLIFERPLTASTSTSALCIDVPVTYADIIVNHRSWSPLGRESSSFVRTLLYASFSMLFSSHPARVETDIRRDPFWVPLRSSERFQRPAPSRAVTSVSVRFPQRLVHDRLQHVRHPLEPATRDKQVLNEWCIIRSSHRESPRELQERLSVVPTMARSMRSITPETHT